LRQEWRDQGHNLNGTFEKAIEYELQSTGEGVKIVILDGTDRGYGKIIDDGVKPEQIKSPYAPARIKGLTSYVERRMGIMGKEAISIAYAIATKHKQEGMPLPSTVIYSTTGKRTAFVFDATGDIDKIIEQYIFAELEETIDV